MLNLVVVESSTNSFGILILPSNVKAYTIRPYDSEETITFIKAYIRNG